MTRVRRWAEVASFGARAEPWLLRFEAEHTVLLGVLEQLELDASVFGRPLYLATVEAGGEVVGCAFRTPPFKLSLTRMPLAGARAVAADVASVYARLPRVGGPEDVVGAFGVTWTRLRGGVAHPGARHRLYRADALVPSARPASGRARPATMDDLELVRTWYVAFEAELSPLRSNAAIVAQRIRQGWLWLWEDGGRPVSLGGWPARGERWVRIGPIYTPPQLRGRGYATAITAHLTRLALAEGRYAVLYTDAANPTSNSIYQRIGYRPLQDSVDLELEGAGSCRAGD